jgi:hypothetical protein
MASVDFGSVERRLVDFVFTKRPDNPPEILRIDATSRLLAHAAHADADAADASRDQFLASFPKNLRQLRALFDPHT